MDSSPKVIIALVDDNGALVGGIGFTVGDSVGFFVGLMVGFMVAF